MANETYSALRKQLEELEKRVQAAKLKEVRGVVKRMQQAIRFYGLTARNLGFIGLDSPLDETPTMGRPVKVFGTYQHGEHVWSGHGPTPTWLKGLMAAGHSKEEFLVRGPDDPQPGVVYRSPKGLKWDGTGKRPDWVRKQLDGGGRLEDFAVKTNGHKKVVKSSGKRRPKPIKYTDGKNTWNGTGTQPRWMRAHVAAGHDLEEYRVGA